jgi:hypothetical protein
VFISYRSDDLRVIWENIRPLHGNLVDRCREGSSILISKALNPITIAVVNSKIYQVANDSEEKCRIAVLSVETGQTLSTIELDLDEPLLYLLEPKCRGVMDRVKHIACRTQKGEDDKEQIVILDLETNEVDWICREKLFKTPFFSKNFLFTQSQSGSSLFQIPSGQLLFRDRLTPVTFSFDLEESVCHLLISKHMVRHIMTFSSKEATPIITEQNLHFDHCGFDLDNCPQILHSAFVFSRRYHYWTLTLSVVPFGTRTVEQASEHRKMIYYLKHFPSSCPKVFVTRSKAIVVAKFGQYGGELALLDFSNAPAPTAQSEIDIYSIA